MKGIRRQSMATKTGSGGKFDLGTILEVPLSEVSVDEVLTKVNPLGRFQQYVLLIIFCGSAPIVGLQNFVLVTQKELPRWHCVSDHCTSLLSPLTGSNNESLLCSLTRDEWAWDNILYNSISQWDIACSKSRMVLEMVFDFPGALFGALIAAYFADKLGRRLSYLVMLISTLTVGTMISSAKYFIAYLIFRLMMGMALTALNIVNYIWILEHFGNSRRGLANAVYDIVGLSCVPILALINVHLTSWNYLHLFSSITLLSGFIVYFFIPESPRWLLLNHRTENAESILKSIALRNNESYPRRVELAAPLQRRGSPEPCCQGSRTTIALLLIIWSNLTIAELSLASKVQHLHTNVNINQSICSAMGIPFIIISGILLCEVLGRRMSFTLTSLLFIVCGLLTLLPVQLTLNKTTADYTPGFAIHIFCPAMVSILNLWTIEILPTSNRVATFGLLISLRHALKVAVPYAVTYADTLYPLCSPIISLTTLLLSVAGAVMLHETRGTHMVEVRASEPDYFELIKDAFNNCTLHSQSEDNKPPVQEWRRLSPILF